MTRCKWLAILPLILILASCSRDPQVQAARYLENGNKFFARGKFKEASIMYRRALQKDMRFGEGWYRLGLTNLKLASFGVAANNLVRAVELQPNNTDAATKLADLYLVAASQDPRTREAYTTEAEGLAQKLVVQNPDSYDGHRLRGQVALIRNDPGTAVKEFGAANQARPNQPDLTVAYFQALLGNKQVAEAETLAMNMIAKEKTYSPLYDFLYLHYAQQRQLDKAEALFKLKSQNNPKNADFVLQLALHYFLVNRRDDMTAQIARLADTNTFPQGHLYAGDFYFFRLRDFQNSQREYEAAIQANPKDRALYEKRLVELFANTGRANEANQLLARILKEDPKDTDAVAIRAALMLTTGNPEQVNLATNDLQNLVNKTPTNHLLRFNLARALVAQGKLDLARLQIEEALKIRTDFVAAREMLARIYLVKGDHARALKEADGALAYDRNSLSAHLVRSSSLLGMNEKDKAREELAYITRVHPQNADARVQVGFMAFQERDFKKSQLIFEELYKENPKDLRGLVGLVEALASQDRMNDALAAVEKSVQREPDRQDFQLALANLYVRSEQYDPAIRILQTLVEKNPKAADLLFRLAEAYRRKGEVNLAIETFRRSSQAAPNETLALLQLGALMDGIGKPEQSKPIYEQILKLQPDHEVALNNLAMLKAEEGVDLDQALTMAQRARQKLPNSPDVADTLGWIYIKKNLSEDAIRIFTDLIQREPKNPTFRYHYGMALIQKGDRLSAKKELETAMRNNPPRDEANKIQDLLKKL